MRKLFAILLVLTLTVTAFAGCGSNSSGTASSTTTENVEPLRDLAQCKYHEAATEFAGGTGTETDPFQISKPGHLVLLNEKIVAEGEVGNWDRTYCAAHYILTADINLNDTSNFESWRTAAPEYAWEPIGRESLTAVFEGVFDGNGHKISGMFIDADSGNKESYYGLFAEMGGTVKNLTVDQSYICVSGGTVTVGTIAGSTKHSDKSVIENCQVSSEIKLYNACEAGGIVGSASTSKVSNCCFSGTISQLDSADSYIGGICASNGSLTGNPNGITGCTFTGTLSGNGPTGGIVGSGDNIKNSVNKGSVYGDEAGGIIGIYVAAGTDLEIEVAQLFVENCINEGVVTGTAKAGGIIGDLGHHESDISLQVIDCENKGQVICDEDAAGIIGELCVDRCGQIKIENCVNHADISGKGDVGGIICSVAGNILHQEGEVIISGCKNLGKITSENLYSAGIVTKLFVWGDEVDLQLSIENCVNEGAVQSASSCAGGILGFSNVVFNASTYAETLNISDNTCVSLSGCKNSGSVTVGSSNAMSGGIVGCWGLGYIPGQITSCVNTGAVGVDFTLTDTEIQEQQGTEWTEFFQIAGGIVGRIGDGLKLTTAEAEQRDTANVNAENAGLVIKDCTHTGKIAAPDNSNILNKWGKPLYVNYLGGIVGQCSATEGYAFRVENCTYSGTERGLGDVNFPDVGTKKA